MTAWEHAHAKSSKKFGRAIPKPEADSSLLYYKSDSEVSSRGHSEDVVQYNINGEQARKA